MAARIEAATSARLIAIGLLGAALAACGGGGESNRPPTATFSATPASGPTPLIVTFDASASTDKEGPIASYAWTTGDGASLSGVTVTHTYPRPGSFTVMLTVTDKKGVTATVSQVVTVENRPPVAAFTATPESGRRPLLVSFDATTSGDPDGSIVSFAWQFGDGTQASGAKVQHTYNEAGVVDAVLTVTDDSGAKSEQKTSIGVAALADEPQLLGILGTRGGFLSGVNNQLFWIDAKTGRKVLLFDIDELPADRLSCSGLAELGGVLYALCHEQLTPPDRPAWSMLGTIDLNTGALSELLILKDGEPWHGLTASDREGRLFVIDGPIYVGVDHFLLKSVTPDGTASDIGVPFGYFPPYDVEIKALAYDDGLGTLYASGSDRGGAFLGTLDTTNAKGARCYRGPLANGDKLLIAYDEKGGVLFGHSTNAGETLGRVDPTSGTFTPIGGTGALNAMTWWSGGRP